MIWQRRLGLSFRGLFGGCWFFDDEPFVLLVLWHGDGEAGCFFFDHGRPIMIELDLLGLCSGLMRSQRSLNLLQCELLGQANIRVLVVLPSSSVLFFMSHGDGSYLQFLVVLTISPVFTPIFRTNYFLLFMSDFGPLGV